LKLLLAYQEYVFSLLLGQVTHYQLSKSRHFTHNLLLVKFLLGQIVSPKYESQALFQLQL